MNLTTDQIAGIILYARNQNTGDSAHVNHARSDVDAAVAKAKTWFPGEAPATGTTSGPAMADVIGLFDQTRAQIVALYETPTTPAEPEQPAEPDPSPTPSEPEEPAAPTEPSTTPANIDEAFRDSEFTKPFWLGNWSGDIKAAVATIVKEAGDKRAVMIPYNIPNRDLGSYSAGGLGNMDEYRRWIDQMAEGAGSGKALFVLEPDAIGHARGMSETDRQARLEVLAYAAAKLKENNPNALVYIDASMWGGVEEMSDYLRQIDALADIDGFSVNVSGYDALQNCIAFGDQVAAKTGLKYVVDTSRNGRGNPRPGKWCNVTDTKVGLAATRSTGNPNCFAYLWLKVPGESDGLGINDDGSNPRQGVPSAGHWWPEFADAIFSGDWTAFKAKYGE